MDRIRIGIVGCGTITRNVHLPVLLALPEVEVAWLADTNASSGAALARAGGVAFHKVSEPIALPEADLVVLALPNGARGPYYDYFRDKRDVGLYVEKPFARSAEEHERITRGKEPWQVAVGLDRRSFALTRLAREVFVHRPFGRPLAMKMEFGGLGRVLVGDSYMSDSTLAGGGALYQMGVHLLDAALFASGARQVDLRGGRMISSNGMDVHVEGDLDVAIGESESIPLRVLVTQLRAADNRITFDFETASVSLSIFYGAKSLEITPPNAREPRWNLAPDPSLGPLDIFATFATHWRSVIESFRTRSENYTSASRAALTSRALELLYSLPDEEGAGRG